MTSMPHDGVVPPPRVLQTADLFCAIRLALVVALGAGTAVGAQCRRGLQRVDPVAPAVGASSVLWGDFDEDGRLDAATTRAFEGSVVMLNRGSEMFEPGEKAFAPASSMGGWPDDALLEGAGDVSGDGHLDLIYRHWNRTWVRFGDGHGGFGEFIGTLDLPSSVQWRLADIDGDGRPDFFDAKQYAIRILRGRQDGTFEVATEFGASDIDWSTATLMAGDFDGDGRVDLAGGGSQLASSRPNLCVLWNDDGLHFTERCLGFSGSAHGRFGAVDIDGDGRLEVVATQSNELVFISAHDRKFDTSRMAIKSLPALSAVGAADFDGDGQRDLVLALGATVAVLWGTGPGQFSQPTYFAIPGVDSQISLGDIDGDGTPDIAAGVFVLHGRRGSRDLAAPLVRQFDIVSVSPGQVGDINGDGALDTVGGGYGQGDIQVLWGDKSGGFRVGPIQPAVGTVVALADLDGDGQLDLAVNRAVGTPAVFYGDGSGAFTPGTAGIASGPFSATVTLTGGHGVGMLAIAGQDLQIARFGSDRNVSVSTIATLVAPPKYVVAADTDGDGDSDLVAVSSTGLLQLIMQSIEGWSKGAEVNCAGYCGYDGVAVADLDGDGRPDIIAWQSGQYNVLLQNSDATFSLGNWYPTPGTDQLLISDFDADGRPDVITMNRGLVRVDRNLGAGSFEPSVAARAGNDSWTIISDADLDGDGWRDLLVDASGGVETLRNVCDAPRVRATFVPPAPVAGQPVTLLAYVLPVIGNSNLLLSIFEDSALVYREQDLDYGFAKWSSAPLRQGTFKFSLVYEDQFLKETEISLIVNVQGPRVRRHLPSR